jgi:hypothetical protein
MVSADTDPMYASDAQTHQIMSTVSKISFCTCLRSVYLPGSYIMGLAQAPYPTVSASGEPQTFTTAFNHWFLCEILAAIGP